MHSDADVDDLAPLPAPAPSAAIAARGLSPVGCLEGPPARGPPGLLTGIGIALAAAMLSTAVVITDGSGEALPAARRRPICPT